MKAKRTVAGILACTMLASTVVCISASAADATVTLAGEKVNANAGEEFSVDVSLTDIPASKINVLDFAMTYDNAALTVDQVVIGDSANVAGLDADTTAADAPVFATNIKDSEITVSWTTALSSDAWIETDGVILTIKGTVKADAKDGVYPISFAPVTRETHQGSGVQNTKMVIGYVYGSDAASYEIKTDDGSVMVGSAVTTETSDTTATTDSASTTTETTATTSGTGSTPAVPSEVLYGDTNLDGKVELTDAILLNKAIAGVVILTGDAVYNADCNANSEMDQDDGIALLKFLVHSIDSLPAVQ